MRSGIHSASNLEEQTGVAAGGEEQEAKPMSERPFRQPVDRISLRLSGELVAIPRDNQKILNVNPNCLAIAPPKWSDRVQQESQRIYTDVPELLVPILVLLLKSR